MSLDNFKAKVDALRTQAENISKSYEADVRSIANDPNLSEAGRASQREEVRASVKPRLSALRAEEEKLIDQHISERQSKIESRSGVTSTDIIAFRDAQDRADRFEKQSDALPVLDRALRQGDTSLAHAIFRRGLEAGWRDVATRFTTEHPDLSDTVRELRWLTDLKANTFQRTIAYAFLSR